MPKMKEALAQTAVPSEIQIEEMERQPVELPSDGTMACRTGRPELLKLACRAMTAAEVGAVLNVLGRTMIVADLRLQLINEQKKRLAYLEERLQDIRNMIRGL